MKAKIIVITLLVILTSTFAGQTYAHNHHSDSTKVSVADSLMQIEMEKRQQMEAVDAFPNYHPLVVHFPIVLLLMAAMFQLLSFFYLKREFSLVTLILLAFGVITAWLANNTFHADAGILTGTAKEIFDTHEQMAILTWWLSLIALIGKSVSHFFLNRKMVIEMIIALLLIASGITVSIAGHHGAMLVHMEGIGPLGKYLEEYKLPANNPINTLQKENNNSEENAGEQEEDHHVGEIGKGPHGGTVEEAEPFHMEIMEDGNNLLFYLLDGDAKPLDMEGVTGSVKILSVGKSAKIIPLMMMDNKLTAMQANIGLPFTANCTLTKEGKSYTSSFTSAKDLPSKK